MDKQAAMRTDLLYRGTILISFLAGIALRIFHLFRIGFDVPFDMGGLFYQMSLEIIKNKFLSPASIPYYYPGGLPFVYPPLPFYVQAVFIKLLSPGNYFVSNILPPLFSVISQVAFFFLARQVIKQKVGVVAAAFTFAIIPIAFIEQIQAMGLAESIGTLVLILYLLTLLQAASKPQKKQWIIPGIILGICVMSSPGSIYASVLISILFFGISMAQFISHKDSSLLTGCLIVGLTGLFTASPYWITVTSHHGIGILLNAFSTQNSGLFDRFISSALDLQFIHASLFWNILFLLGFISAVFKKKVAIILLSLVTMIIPREYWIMSIPASLLIGFGIQTLLDFLQPLPKAAGNYLKVAIIWILILFFMIDSSYRLNHLINDDMYDISAGQINELETMHACGLIPHDQPVVVVGNWGLIEWAPAILERDVINNPFGLEWLPERNQEMLRLSEDLPKMVDPAEIMAAVEKSFGGISQVFIIADKDYLRVLNDPELRGGVMFLTLKEFNELGLGLISVRQ